MIVILLNKVKEDGARIFVAWRIVADFRLVARKNKNEHRARLGFALVLTCVNLLYNPLHGLLEPVSSLGRTW